MRKRKDLDGIAPSFVEVQHRAAWRKSAERRKGVLGGAAIPQKNTLLELPPQLQLTVCRITHTMSDSLASCRTRVMGWVWYCHELLS